MASPALYRGPLYAARPLHISSKWHLASIKVATCRPTRSIRAQPSHIQWASTAVPTIYPALRFTSGYVDHYHVPAWLARKLLVPSTSRLRLRVYPADLEKKFSVRPTVFASMRRSVLENFIAESHNVHHRGLACLVASAPAVAKSLPIHLNAMLSLLPDGANYSLRITTQHLHDTSHRLHFILTPTRTKGAQAKIESLGHDTVTATFILRLYSDIEHQTPNGAQSTQPVVELHQQMTALVDIFEMVVDRACARSAYSTPEDLVKITAEALSHVLPGDSPMLSPKLIKLNARFQPPSLPARRFSAFVTWKKNSADDLHIAKQDKSRGIDIAVKELSESSKLKSPSPDSLKGETTQVTDNDNHFDDFVADSGADYANEPDSLPADEAFDGASPKQMNESRPTPVTRLITEPDNELVERRQRSRSTGQDTDSKHTGSSSASNSVLQSSSTRKTPYDIRFRTKLTSNMIEQKTSMHSVSILLQWSPTFEHRLEQYTEARLLQAVNDLIADVTRPSLFEVFRSMSKLRRRIPGRPYAKFVFSYQRWSDGQDLILTCMDNRVHVRHVLRVPGLRFDRSSVNGQFLLRYAVYFSDLEELASVTDEISASAARIRVCLNAQVQYIIDDHAITNVQDLVESFSEAVGRVAQPIAGLIRCTSTKAIVERLQNGEVTEEAEARVNHRPRSTGSKQGIFVALGGNLGDRFAAIERACQKIDESPDMRVVKTSALYETEPMYVEDQERFLNGVCQIDTQLEPMDLLDRLQSIENDLGRVKIVDKGPRNIDLDIAAYHDSTMESERLVIPHPLMLEREFVLRPLSDIAPSFLHPITQREIASHLAELPTSTTPIYPATPLAPGSPPLRALDPARKTILMSIMNITPDSFSDGGVHRPTDQEALKATAASHIAAGATIIDIGGQSSRPNAADVTAEEELARVLPAIEAIKSLPESAGVAISVDTYRAQVAEAAIKAGAHIINDISAGLLDDEMLPTIARMGCTYIMMHMRGTPHTMQNEENTSYPNGVLQTIASELTARLDAAQSAGIRRWRIILDPGVGFAKTTEQNLEILTNLGKLREDDSALRSYPWLVGSSRKRFIGQITGVETAAERVTGTAATVTAAVAGGAEIVRVHDVKEMAQVVKMADAMYRSPSRRELK